MPAISVLIPCYNTVSYVAAAVRSVVDQSFTDWELIIVDDGSSDGTGKVLDSLLQKYQKFPITVIQQKHAGCAAATKLAIHYATVPICTVLDSDDVLLLQSLATIIRALDARPDVGFFWTRWEGMKTRRRGWSKALPPGKSLKQALLSQWWGAQCQRAFRVSAYKKTCGLDPSLVSAVDLQLAALFAELGCPTLDVDVVTYLYRGPNQNRQVQLQCSHEIIRRLRDGKFRPPVKGATG